MTNRCSSNDNQKRSVPSGMTALRPTPLAGAVATAIAVLALGSWSVPANAFRFETESVKGSFDSTISFGMIQRLQKPDRGVISNDNGGNVPISGPFNTRANAYYGYVEGSGYEATANPDFNYLQADDGDLNYKKGDIVSAALKGTHELVVELPDEWSAMVRATWFRDWRTSHTRRTPLDPRSRSKAVDDFTWLDAWVAKGFEIGGRPAKIKLGNQVISWGEDIFIYGGVNVTNAINLQSAHAPGMQLKEIFRPAPMASFSADLTDSLSVEAYYQFRWNAFKFDPVGTFFSVVDLIGPGAGNAFASSSLLGLPTNTIGDLGSINPATGRPFTLEELGPTGSVGGPFGGTAVHRLPTNSPKDSGQFGLAAHYLAENIDTEFGFYWIRYHDKIPFIGFNFDTARNPNVAALGYFVDYGEDRNVFGVSANTMLGGWAVGAELSYRPKDSVGIDPTILPDGKYSVFDYDGKTMRGFVTERKWQAHLTGFKLLAPSDLGGMIGNMGAAEGFFLGEVAVAHYPGLDRSGRIPYLLNDASIPSKTSAGLVIATGLTWANVADSGWNVSPEIDVSWNFAGTSPNAVPFIKGSKAASFLLNFNRSDKWSIDLGYTRFWGGGGNNTMKDRDYLSLVGSVSF